MFASLQERLREIGSHYGALAAHEGLWESARATAHSLAARLAIESCVHEARGLDVLPSTIARFRAGGDATTADLLLQTVLPVRSAAPFESCCNSLVDVSVAPRACCSEYRSKRRFATALIWHALRFSALHESPGVIVLFLVAHH